MIALLVGSNSKLIINKSGLVKYINQPASFLYILIIGPDIGYHNKPGNSQKLHF
jgi:hypothetical protein